MEPLLQKIVRASKSYERSLDVFGGDESEGREIARGEDREIYILLIMGLLVLSACLCTWGQPRRDGDKCRHDLYNRNPADHTWAMRGLYSCTTNNRDPHLVDK